MKRKIYFRADAGVDIGYGHFIRTLALADMLKDDFDCFFVTQTPTLYQKTEIAKVCSLIELPASEGKFGLFLEMLQGDEIVVLDNYFYDTDYQRKIRAKGCKLVCVDDMHDKHYVADVVINHGTNDITLFDVEPYTVLCLGMEWALLRFDFLNKKYRRHTTLSDNAMNAVVCFGGSDYNDLTHLAVSYLNGIKQISRIIAIVGDTYLGVKVNTPPIEYKHNLVAKEISTIFRNADLAIVSASTVCFEALACDVTVLAGYYVDNQKGIYNYLDAKGLIFPMGNLNTSMEEAIAIYFSTNYRQQKSEIDFSIIPIRYIELFSTL